MSWYRRAQTGGAAALMLAIAAACSSSGTAETSTPADTQVTAPDTAASTVTDPEPPPTDATTTSTTSTTTTAAPTTTIDPVDALTAEIEADLNEGEQAFLEAGADPGNPESRELLSAFFAFDSLVVLEDFLDELVENGAVTRPGEVESSITVVSVDDAGDERANLTLCRIDAGVVLIPDADEGDPTIVDDVVYRYTASAEVRFLEGRWKLSANNILTTETGEPACE